MPRAPQFDQAQILDAAERLIARHGPSGATIGAIAQAVGAPTGSIYHRFDSRDVLLAEVWLLLLHRREDFVDRGWPATMRRRAEQLGRQVETDLRAFSSRLCGRQDARTVRSITYALVEAPVAAVRRHVAAEESPPAYVDGLIRTTYEAVIRHLGVSRNKRSIT